MSQAAKQQLAALTERRIEVVNELRAHYVKEVTGAADKSILQLKRQQKIAVDKTKEATKAAKMAYEAAQSSEAAVRNMTPTVRTAAKAGSSCTTFSRGAAGSVPKSTAEREADQEKAAAKATAAAKAKTGEEMAAAKAVDAAKEAAVQVKAEAKDAAAKAAEAMGEAKRAAAKAKMRAKEAAAKDAKEAKAATAKAVMEAKEVAKAAVAKVKQAAAKPKTPAKAKTSAKGQTPEAEQAPESVVRPSLDDIRTLICSKEYALKSGFVLKPGTVFTTRQHASLQADRVTMQAADSGDEIHMGFLSVATLIDRGVLTKMQPTVG